MRALLRAGLRDMLRRPLHTLLMVFGIALGVAVVIAIDLANHSARVGFERSTDAVAGRATHRLAGGPSGVSVALLRRLRIEWGHPPATPVVEGSVGLVGEPREPVRVLGVDPFSEAPFRSHLGQAGRDEPAFARLVTQPGSVLIGAPLATRRGLRPGDPLEVRLDDRFETLDVVGVLEPEPGNDAALDGLLLMDVGQAQRLFRLRDRVTRIELLLDDAQALRLRESLPPGVSLGAAHAQVRAAAELSAAFQLNLTALSLLALLVGLFLIYNTVTFSVLQRRTVFATLRVLGVTPRELVALVLFEASLAALLGSALGIGLGWMLGHGAVQLVTRTINDFYYVLAVRDVSLHAPSVLRGVALGLATGVGAALIPALEAACCEPANALRPSVVETAAHRRLPAVSAVGVALALLGAAVLALFEQPLEASFAGLFALVLGIALLSPVLTLGLMALLTPPLGVVFGPHGRLAARTVGRALSRTGVAIAALMVAVSVTVGVGLMIASFRTTVDEWLGLSLVADVYVTAPSAAARGAPTLSADVAQRIARVEGVAGIETYRGVRVRSSVGEIALGVSDAARGRSAALYRRVEGSPDDVWQRVRGGAVVVSEPFAQRHALPETGAVLTLETARGPRDFPVIGVFYDYSTEEGVVLMSRDVYEAHFDDRGVSSVAAHVAPGAEAERVAQRVREALADRGVLVRSNAALRAQALAVFDRTFAVTDALRLLAVVVAFVGVWSALMSVQLERTREIATLRALGMTPGDVRRVALLETALMGLAAGLISLPTGMLLARVLVDVINVRSFGWSMRLEHDPVLLGQALLLSVAASLLASAYPLWRLGRLPVAAALRQE